jgi:membrane-associated protease RseP (regulator of RpoE activity)
MSFLGILAFVVALLFSIMVHEAGHFLAAKKFNMKVTEFFLGFGKKIWSFTRGETEFGLKSIPAGGYCRIVGMSSREVLTLDEADSKRAFVKASAFRRLIVLGAGSFNHFILGFLIIFVLFVGVGTTVVTPVVAEVVPCVNAVAATSDIKCQSSDTPSPARFVGIKAGDRIISINGVPSSDWLKSVIEIRNNPGKEIAIVDQRGTQMLEFKIVPSSVTRNGKKVGVIGIVNKLGTQTQNPIKATVSAYRLSQQLFTSSISSLIQLPSKVPALIRQTFFHEKRDSTGLVGVVGVARVSGQAASDKNLSVRERLATFMLIIASLNIFVGIFNLLPILPLDGGHMALAFVDGFKRWRAKRLNRPEPAPVDIERLLPITIVVFVILAALSLLLLGADIFNPIHVNL